MVRSLHSLIGLSRLNLELEREMRNAAAPDPRRHTIVGRPNRGIVVRRLLRIVRQGTREARIMSDQRRFMRSCFKRYATMLHDPRTAGNIHTRVWPSGGRA